MILAVEDLDLSLAVQLHDSVSPRSDGTHLN